MSKVSNFVEERMREVHDIKQPEDLRPVSTRMTGEEIEKMSNVASVLDMSKSEFIRTIVSNACDDIIKKYDMKFGPRVGLSAVELLDFEEMSPEDKEKYIADQQGQKEDN